MDANKIKEKANDYYITIELIENKNYEKSKKYLTDLLNCHGLAIGILHELITKNLMVPGETDTKINDMLIQISVFYQGICECDKVIRNGQYNIAAAIVRQEYEIICNLTEIEKGLHKRGKTPNAKNGLPGFGKYYGELSLLTHLIEDDWHYLYKKLHNQPEDNIKPISLIPIFDKEMCINLYGMHIYFILCIIFRLQDLFKKMYEKEFMSDEITKAREMILRVLLDRKIIRYDDNQ